MKEAMQKGEAWAISNRSFMKGAGAAAWTIEGTTQEEGMCTGLSFTLGDIRDQSAFRSKLAGIYGIVFMLEYMMANWEEEDLHLKIACDGKSAVDRLNLKKLIKPTEAHYDILAAIQKIRARLLLTITLHHVKGHQDMGLTMVVSREACDKF